MNANQATRSSGSPDGGQMLLLAGFVISATAIMAIGAYTALQSGDTQISERTNRPLVDLFLNTRERAVDFFGMVTADDTAISVQNNLDSYLFSQYQTARSMSLQLNASLAGEDTPSRLQECPHFVSAASAANCDSSDEYENRAGGHLWSHNGAECYSGRSYDGTNDGLITASDGRVLGAIFWLNVEGVDTELEEFVVIDVPETEVASSCGPGTWEGAWGDNSPTGYDDTFRDVDNTTRVPFAVGDNGVVMERSDDGSWTEIDSNGPSDNGNNLRGSDPTDDGQSLWAVGTSGEVGEYDASSGTLAADHSQPDGSTSQFNDVAVTGNAGSATIFVVDANGVIHRGINDGSSWSTTTPGGGNEIHAIDFYSSQDGIAVDDSGDVFETSNGGDSWTRTHDTSRALHGVEGVASDDLWVAAAGGVVLHWDGSSWSQTVVDPDGDDLLAIEMEGGEGHVVGQSGKIYHWDGTEWSQETSWTSSDLHGTSIDDRAIAVGTDGTIVET